MSTKTKSPERADKTNPKSKIQNPKSHTSPPRLAKIFAGLDALFPQAQCALQHENPFQLLVATILSAQCTDERVNKVTPELFRQYPTPQDFVGVAQPDVEQLIHSAGFFRNKAKSIIGAATKIVQDFGGQVPRSMDELLSLPGVARKTANVVLGTGYGIASGVVVDTHVFRITHRLKLTREKTPEKVEQDLMKLVPKERWVSFSHQVIWFGRKICVARKPLCMECPLATLCDAPDKTI
ncbi:MAG: endonuclease III [Acidobacteriota bacterium]|nr:endonuclease III [Acidobacteriota bacterium]